jgi:hypothetical protein
MRPAATLGVFIVFVALALSPYSQQSVSWRDASPHTVRFVTASPGAGSVPPGSLLPKTRLIAFVTKCSPFSKR